MDLDPSDIGPIPDPPDADVGDPAPPEPTTLAAALPRELGVMLVSAGVIGMVLPGPGTPALIAGGLILWPDAFGKAERWFQRRFPRTHRQGIGHINRFLSDLERRYPGSTRPAVEKPESKSS